jgi:hypothetical protein
MYIKRFENFSTDYYDKFSIKDFPSEIEFSEPFNVVYKQTKLVPNSNNIILRFDLESEQPEKDNPYSGDIPEIVKIDIGITYNNETTKIYVSIDGGNRTWWAFTYENGMIENTIETDVKLSDKSYGELIEVLKKYSV